MKTTFKRLSIILMVAGVFGISAYAQQTGPKIIPRDRTSPSVKEGLSGTTSAGVKTNIDPAIGQTPVFMFSPFRSFPAIGSLVQPRGVPAPLETDPSTVGLKHIFSQIFFAPSTPFSLTDRINRLFAGVKGIGGKNVTDVGLPGQVGGTGPGDLYWVGYPRPGNTENPPPVQFLHHPNDCYCRWDQQIKCPLPGPFANQYFFGPLAPVPREAFTPCQACFAGHIVKHDYYVGLEQDKREFIGYPVQDPSFSGYQECLRQSIESYATSGPGGSPGNANYGL